MWYVYAVRGVAQHDSALALGARSRWFKSSRPDHFFDILRAEVILLFLSPPFETLKSVFFN
jgi:hypothetical protein